MRAALALLILLGLGCASAPPPPPAVPGTTGVAGTGATDFGFVRGAPAGGVRLTACGRVTVSTTNTERSGANAFRVDPAHPAEPVTVTFRFDRAIAAFDMTVGGLRTGDMLGDFNVGNPPRLSGNLIQTADGRVTAGAAVGAGTLSWPDLDAREIKLGARGATIVFERFRVACRTSSEPITERSTNRQTNGETNGDPSEKHHRPLAVFADLRAVSGETTTQAMVQSAGYETCGSWRSSLIGEEQGQGSWQAAAR